jgi:hypothetical protein
LIANARQRQLTWRSLKPGIVHGDPNELMILNINSAPRKAVGSSNTAGASERIWFSMTEESKNKEMRIHARMVKVRRRFST